MSWADVVDARAVLEVDLPGARKRLKEAILYVCKQAEGMALFGAIKLNKILWRADFRSFAEREVPVTGRAYQRLEMGPAPAEMPPVINELLRRNLLRIERRKIGRGEEHRHIALAEASLRDFTPNDLEYLDEAVQHYWSKTGRESSDESHGVAWKTRKNGEPMPYQLAFLRDGELPPATAAKLAQIGKERGWRSE